ncbi:MAG TPA: preprotein translocase subunit YajC [Acidimicrobiales bacterium]|nr:preprotein translocase subunit YajC [Acidimicrobiales bacterium]
MHSLVALVLAATSKTTTSTGSSVGSLIFIMVIGLAAYAFFIRPRSQAARRQRDTLMELSAGDEVLTGAGIFGTVLDVAADRVTIETAPGTRITVLRSTIARRITQPDDERGGPGHDEEREGVGWQHGEIGNGIDGPGHDDPHGHDDPGSGGNGAQ